MGDFVRTRSYVDPRPPRPALPSPAPRPTGRRHLVLLDNGKLSPPYTHWLPLWDPLLYALRALGTVTTERADLMDAAGVGPDERAAAWASRGVDGVVVLLGDGGVAVPTLRLAATAEACGIPTVTLGLADLAPTLASFVATACHGMPVVTLDVNRLDTADRIVSVMHAALPLVVAGLTEPPDALAEQAAREFPAVETIWRPTHSNPAAVPFEEFCRTNHLDDGLPVWPVSQGDIDECAATLGLDPGAAVIAAVPPTGATLTVANAVVASLMARCPVAAVPLVIAALRAMGEPPYNLGGALSTSHSGGHLLLFSGPAAAAAGVTSGRGCLGPGHATNLAISRAVSLALLHVGRAIPGHTTLSTFGSPAQVTFCFADRGVDGLPALAERHGAPSESLVLVHKSESPRSVTDRVANTPEAFLDAVASAAIGCGNTNAYLPSDLVVVLNPEHARLITAAGWSAADASEYLWRKARNSRASLKGHGVKDLWPARWAAWDEIPVVPGPDAIHVVTAGTAGAASHVILPWGFSRAVVRHV